MAESKIEWCRYTWNVTAGCDIVSAGCSHCYAMPLARRLELMGQSKYAGTTKVVNGSAVWTGAINIDYSAIGAPLMWNAPRWVGRKPRWVMPTERDRVFVDSMSDLFHPGVPQPVRDHMFAMMAACWWLDFLILTKRPEAQREYLSDPDVRERIENYSDAVMEEAGELGLFDPLARRSDDLRAKAPDVTDDESWPLPNVWCGTSTEDQRAWDERKPHLRETPAAVRFVSAEPLLSGIDMGDIAEWLHLVIAGGESGPRARPFVLGWGKDIVRQCRAADVAVFVKQIGARPTNREGVPHLTKDRKGGDMSEWPAELRVREMPR